MGLARFIPDALSQTANQVRLMSTQDMLTYIESEDYIPLNKHPGMSLQPSTEFADMVSVYDHSIMGKYRRKVTSE